jgi:hypothetical protein
MVRRFAENIITAHYDKKASDHAKRAGLYADRADNANDPKQRQKLSNAMVRELCEKGATFYFTLSEKL